VDEKEDTTVEIESVGMNGQEMSEADLRNWCAMWVSRLLFHVHYE